MGGINHEEKGLWHCYTHIRFTQVLDFQERRSRDLQGGSPTEDVGNFLALMSPGKMMHGFSGNRGTNMELGATSVLELMAMLLRPVL